MCTGSTSVFQLHFFIEILMHLVRDASMPQVREVCAQVNVKIVNVHFKAEIVYSIEKPLKLRRKKINNGNKSSKKWRHLVIQVWKSTSRTPKSKAGFISIIIKDETYEAEIQKGPSMEENMLFLESE